MRRFDWPCRAPCVRHTQMALCSVCLLTLLTISGANIYFDPGLVPLLEVPLLPVARG